MKEKNHKVRWILLTSILSSGLSSFLIAFAGAIALPGLAMLAIKRLDKRK